MRALSGFLITLLVVVVLLGLYFALGRNQLTKQITTLKAEQERLENDIQRISGYQREIPALRAKLPQWQAQVRLFRDAIPTDIEDDRFFAAITEQLQQQNIDLLGVEVSPGGPWLGVLKDEDKEVLAGKGVNVEAAMAVRVAFYSIKLSGDYGSVVQAFENLKRYRRLYTLDQVAAPSGGSGGSILETVDQASTPLQLTGKIFYGIPANYLSNEELVKMLEASNTGAVETEVIGTATDEGAAVPVVPAPADASAEAGE